MDTIGPDERRGLLAPPAGVHPGRADWTLLVIAFVGLAGTALLGNPAGPARPWPEGSILRYVVGGLSLGYSLPTLRGVEIKNLLVTLLAGGLLVWATVRARRSGLRLLTDWSGATDRLTDRVGAASLSLWAVLLLILWSLASMAWAADWPVALGATFIMAIGWLWAAGLALHGHRRLVRPMVDVLLLAASLTAILSLWYWRVRTAEDDTRLGWPMGNPLSLASIMAPAIVLGLGRAVEQVDRLREGLRGDALLRLAIYLLAVALTGATLLASGSRGALLAVLLGLAAAGWVTLGVRGRIAGALVALLAVALVAPVGADWLFRAGGGRDASARMRLYAWRDALRMGWEKPAAGHGAGAFALLGTRYGLREAVADPLATSGQISAHAHSEPLELFSGTGAFGLLLGLAAWSFAFMAAAGHASGPDRWIAAAVAGAVLTGFVDASTGVSWRLPGPAPWLALPVALAWMLWRDRPGSVAPAARDATALVPALLGAALVAGGTLDFVAARHVWLADRLSRQAAGAIARADAPADRETLDMAAGALEHAQTGRLLRLDPPRRLAAWIGYGQMHQIVAYAPLRAGDSQENTQLAMRLLQEGVDLLESLLAVAPAFGDARWSIAELLDGQAGLARQAGRDEQAQQLHQAAREHALAYLEANPLDGARIWRTFSAWPQIPPHQHLELLRGTLREESEVWRAGKQPASPQPAWQQWTERVWPIQRLWRSLPQQGQDAASRLLAAGYTSLQIPYSDWPDLLAPEGVRLVAAREVMRGRPEAAAATLETAVLLYEQAGRLLPYSRAAAYLELAAARLRQGPDEIAMARAALAQAEAILRTLPANPIPQRMQEVVQGLEMAAGAIAGEYAGADAAPWRMALDLFWQMPAQRWPAGIDEWARRVDQDLLAQADRLQSAEMPESTSAPPGQVDVPAALLSLAIIRNDAEGAVARLRELLGHGVDPAALDVALRWAAYRWPDRQDLARSLRDQLTSGGS